MTRSNAAHMKAYSTAPIPKPKKLPFWNEISSTTFAPMEIVPRNRDDFEARLAIEDKAPLSLAEVTSGAGTVHHTRGHIARDGVRGYTLTVPLAGDFEIAFDSAAAVPVRIGEFCILDHSRPYWFRHCEPSRAFCVGLTDGFLGEFLAEPRRIGALVHRATGGSSRLLVSLLGKLSREVAAGRAASMTETFARGLGHLIGAAFSDVADVKDSSVKEARKREIRQYIEDNLHDPTLGPDAIAGRFGISTRYLRYLFAEESEPMGAFLLRRRLDICARLLRDPTWQHRSVKDIALHHGFRNATHFGFAFKRQFGLTPSEYRPLDPGRDGDGAAS